MSAPLDVLLPRLHGARKAPARSGVARAYRAACPCCSGHGLPLSLAESDAGEGAPLLVHCFAGCEPGEVLSALSLDWGDVQPAPLAHHIPGNGGPAVWAGLAAAVDGLLATHARLLACVQRGELVDGLHAMLDAGRAAQVVKAMARRATRGAV